MVASHPERVTAADDLLNLLLKAGSVAGTVVGAGSLTTVGFFKALKFLRGRKPDSSRKNDDGTISITVNTTTIVVDPRTAKLLEDVPTRTATEKFAKAALKASGIMRITFSSDHVEGTDADAVELTKSDLGSLQLPEPTDDETTQTVSEHEALLKIVSAQFAGGYLWRFTDGNNTFTASMDDQEFTNKLDQSEIVLSKDDTLRCLLEENPIACRKPS